MSGSGNIFNLLCPRHTPPPKDSQFERICQFITGGANLKHWDLFHNPETPINEQKAYEIRKTPDISFITPGPSSMKDAKIFTSIAWDLSAKVLASILDHCNEVLLTNFRDNNNPSRMYVENPKCLAFLGTTYEYLAIGCSNGTLKILNTKSSNIFKSLTVPIDNSYYCNITQIDHCYAPNDIFLVVFCTDQNNIFSFNLKTDEHIQNVYLADNTNKIPKITCLRFSLHSSYNFATAHANGDVRIWDYRKKSILYCFSSDVDSPITALHFSPFRSELISAGRKDGAIFIFDYEKCKKVGEFIIEATVITSLFFVENGLNLLVGDNQGLVFIYDLRSSLPQCTCKLHSTTIACMLPKYNFIQDFQHPDNSSVTSDDNLLPDTPLDSDILYNSHSLQSNFTPHTFHYQETMPPPTISHTESRSSNSLSPPRSQIQQRVSLQPPQQFYLSDDPRNYTDKNYSPPNINNNIDYVTNNYDTHTHNGYPISNHNNSNNNSINNNNNNSRFPSHNSGVKSSFSLISPLKPEIYKKDATEQVHMNGVTSHIDSRVSDIINITDNEDIRFTEFGVVNKKSTKGDKDPIPINRYKSAPETEIINNKQKRPPSKSNPPLKDSATIPRQKTNRGVQKQETRQVNDNKAAKIVKKSAINLQNKEQTKVLKVNENSPPNNVPTARKSSQLDKPHQKDSIVEMKKPDIPSNSVTQEINLPPQEDQILNKNPESTSPQSSSSSMCGLSSRNNELQAIVIKDLLEEYVCELKDAFHQSIISIMSETTRQFTNQQLEIKTLHAKVDALTAKVDDLTLKLSRNPHLL